MAATRSAKTTAPAVSATTFAVLVAMAAAVGAGPVPAQADGPRGLSGQRESVAAMAAAVAAVARDFLVEPSSSALPALMPATGTLIAPDAFVVEAIETPVLGAGPPLSEQLLDLPPPVRS